MDNDSGEQFVIMKATIEANKKNIETNNKYYDDKMMKLIEYFKAMLTSTITSMMDEINMSKSSPAQKDSPKAQYPTTVVPSHRMYPPLDGGHS